MQTFSKTTNCKQILFASFEKIYPCLFIPNCTRNHVITYTKLEIRDRRKRKIYWKDKHFDKLPTLTAVLLTERKSKLFVYNQLPEKYYSTSFYNEKQTETPSALQQSVTKDELLPRISEDTLTRGKDKISKRAPYLSGLCPLCVKYVIKCRLLLRLD